MTAFTADKDKFAFKDEDEHNHKRQPQQCFIKKEQHIISRPLLQFPKMSNEITSGTDLRVLSDEPSLSSAALSTTLQFLNDDYSFRPEFTHQCLPGEMYRGHCPRESVMQEKNHSLYHPDAFLHKSHELHSKATYFLDVQIRLAPSCQKCQVIIKRTPITTTSCTSEMSDNATEPPAKKLKPPPLVQPLTEEEIKASIAKALPSITEEDCQEEFLDEPVGSILTEYSCRRREGKDQQHFVVTVADGPSVTEFHSKVQKLALWFIENADDVDIGDDQSGFWKVVYLFQKHETAESLVNKYSLVGYMTLFHFNAPFHKPTPGIIVRICQALVLPPFQGQGHGTRMMQCVYDMAHGKYSNDICCKGENGTIVQVNVEDPSPGFIFLRNTVDYRFLTRLDSLQQWWPAGSPIAKIIMQSGENATEASSMNAFLDCKDAFCALSEEEALQGSSKAKILPRQVQIVNELVHLQFLLASLGGYEKQSGDKEELEKRFRLMVKKRLNREHREEMSCYPTKDEKKAYLARLYDEEMEPYKTWMNKQEQRLQKRKAQSSLPTIHDGETNENIEPCEPKS